MTAIRMAVVVKQTAATAWPKRVTSNRRAATPGGSSPAGVKP
jgi:hypothetical protein